MIATKAAFLIICILWPIWNHSTISAAEITNSQTGPWRSINFKLRQEINTGWFITSDDGNVYYLGDYQPYGGGNFSMKFIFPQSLGGGGIVSETAGQVTDFTVGSSPSRNKTFHIMSPDNYWYSFNAELRCLSSGNPTKVITYRLKPRIGQPMASISVFDDGTMGVSWPDQLSSTSPAMVPAENLPAKTPESDCKSPDQTTPSKSSINNVLFSYLHDAVDYAVGDMPAGCTTCGGSPQESSSLLPSFS